MEQRTGRAELMFKMPMATTKAPAGTSGLCAPRRPAHPSGRHGPGPSAPARMCLAASQPAAQPRPREPRVGAAILVAQSKAHMPVAQRDLPSYPRRGPSSGAAPPASPGDARPAPPARAQHRHPAGAVLPDVDVASQRRRRRVRPLLVRVSSRPYTGPASVPAWRPECDRFVSFRRYTTRAPPGP